MTTSRAVPCNRKFLKLSRFVRSALLRSLHVLITVASVTNAFLRWTTIVVSQLTQATRSTLIANVAVVSFKAWLNNCVGHNNHRYFLLFGFYMWLGTTYASAIAYPLFKKHFYGEVRLEVITGIILFRSRVVTDFLLLQESAPSGFVFIFYYFYNLILSNEIEASPALTS